MKQAAIIGAGTMGSGIAQAFAASGKWRVILCDINETLAENGRGRIQKGLDKLVNKGKIDQEVANGVLTRIAVGSLEAAQGSRLVVEAALERMDVKRDIFKALARVCGEETIFASNTSSLSLTEMAADLGRSVVGMHFFNPAPVMKLVEVTAGLDTPPETVAQVMSIAEELGKTPVQVQEGPGFVVNRILIPMINEAALILSEGIASAEDIDVAMKLGANHPMGPLALGDLIGLDVCLAIMEVLQAETGDSKYRPAPILRKLVRGGRLGRKSGAGFFAY